MTAMMHGTAATVVKHSSLLALKDLVSLHNRRRRKSRDLEPIGLLFGRDVEQICCRGKLSASLTVSRRPASVARLAQTALLEAY